MRAIVTGQVGVEKKPYLELVKQIAARNGHDLVVCHVGDMMYQEAPDVPKGRILNLPITRLNTLRRAVFKEIQRIASEHEHVIVNTHATFRWRHGLFAAFDYDQMQAFNVDLYLTLLDNAESVHGRLNRDHDIDHSLKDVMVWREEELLATEILANIAKGHGHFYMISRGREKLTAETVYRLLFEPWRKRVYPSFPMTHVMDLPETLGEIERFKEALYEHFICFDPADVDEFVLHTTAVKAMAAGEERITVQAADGPDHAQDRRGGGGQRRHHGPDLRPRLQDGRPERSDRVAGPRTAQRQAGTEQRRGARAAPRLRGRQGGVRRLGLPGDAQPVHHRDRDPRV